MNCQCFGQSVSPLKWLCDIKQNSVGRLVPLETDKFHVSTTTEGLGSSTTVKTVAREFVGWEACVTENLPKFVSECGVCNGNVVIFSVTQESRRRLGDREF